MSSDAKTTDPFDLIYAAKHEPQNYTITYVAIKLEDALTLLPGASLKSSEKELAKLYSAETQRVAPPDKHGILRLTPALHKLTERLGSAYMILREATLRESVKTHSKIAIISVEPSMGSSRILCSVDTAEAEHFTGYG